MIVGTTPYASPEQLEGKDLDARADIFSLGVVLYEMATGERPFRGDSAASVISSILKDEPREAREIRRDLPPKLDALISRCLQKDRENRFSSAKEVRDRLQSLVHEKASSMDTAKKPSAAGPARRFRRAATLVAAAGLAIAALFFAYWISNRPPIRESPEAGPVASAPAVASASSIAVLPFADMSPEGDQEYFADGLSEEIINALAQVRGLKVVGRTSSFHFKGRSEDLRTIGERLNVGSILEGSVRTDGDRLRITAQLIDVADGFHLWSESYDRDLGNVFQLQEEIATTLVGVLRAEMLPDEGQPFASRSGSGTGYRAYLQGRFHVERRTQEDLELAVEHFREALALDPGYALAWAGLADALRWQTAWDYRSETGWEEARAAAEKALRLDPNLAEGWAAKGKILLFHDRSWGEARDAYARALELKPNDADIVRDSARLAAALGDLEKALSFNRRAVELDPLDVPAYFHLGLHAFYAGRLEEARKALEESIELEPDHPGQYELLAAVYLEQGAIESAKEMVALEPHPAWRLYGRILLASSQGLETEADALLDRFIAQYPEGWDVQIAELWALRGSLDEAFNWLDRAFESRDGGLARLKVDPFFQMLHSDPRWERLLERMGLPE
jgi:serine/threonine-protein kinase